MLLSICSSFAGIDLGGPLRIRLFLADVTRLGTYLREHVLGLSNGEVTESPVFVPTELDFQVQALDGEVESLFDGYFTIAFSVRRQAMGMKGGGNFGFEGVVYLPDIYRFCAELDVLAVALGLPAE